MYENKFNKFLKLKDNVKRPCLSGLEYIFGIEERAQNAGRLVWIKTFICVRRNDYWPALLTQHKKPLKEMSFMV